jgi:hypothetical protein
MTSPVHRIHYEVAAEAMTIVADHYARVEERRRQGMAIAEQYGADGFRPNSSTGIRHLIFKARSTEVPPGFKYAASEAGGRIACTPHKGTAIGKQAVAALATLEHVPTSEDLAAALGYSVSAAPMDGYKIYWPSAYRFLFPTERVFLSIPRQAGDGWEPPAHLLEVPTSTFMLAMEAHNAEARRQQEADTAEAA